jgi:hypothetical protein
MKLSEILENTFSSYMDKAGLAWWIEIVTDEPKCIYYFGPFVTKQEAERAQSGYIEDLEAEGAQNITVQIQRCHPVELTIFEES